MNICFSTCNGLLPILSPLSVYKTRPRQPVPVPNQGKCYCASYELDSVDVFEALGRKADELERLVVYFYKDKATKDLIAYTPNKDKQRQIPDLPYVNGDGLLTVGTETVVDMFENNPNIVVVPSTSHSHHALRPLDYAVPDSAIGVNIGTINNVPANKLSPANVNVHRNISIKHIKAPVLDYPPSLLNYQTHYTTQIKHVPSNVSKLNGTKIVYPKEKHLHLHDNVHDNHNFNLWIDEQLKHILKSEYSQSINTVDVQNLREQVMMLLIANDLVYDGVSILDKYGNYVDLRTFKLDPLVAENTRGKSILENLNGLMVAHGNPPKVLGTTVLNKKYAPDFYVPNDYLPHVATVRPIIPHHPKKKDMAQILEIIETIVKTFGQYFDPGIVDELLKYLDTVKKHSSLLLGRKLPSDMDDLEPWFRIVGGSAALNSGAPVSNKGRSGLIEAFTDFLG